MELNLNVLLNLAVICLREKYNSNVTASQNNRLWYWRSWITLVSSHIHQTRINMTWRGFQFTCVNVCLAKCSSVLTTCVWSFMVLWWKHGWSQCGVKRVYVIMTVHKYSTDPRDLGSPHHEFPVGLTNHSLSYSSCGSPLYKMLSY